MDIVVTVPTEAVADGLDGAVVEIYRDPATGYYAAEVRIPAPGGSSPHGLRVYRHPPRVQGGP